MSVSGAVVVRATSRLAGPAATTGAESGAVVYESPNGSAMAMSVSVGESLRPTMAVLYGSDALGIDATAGYAWVASGAGPSPSVPSLSDVAVPLFVGSRFSVGHVVP